MITAQDIREKTFEKSTFGGYAMGEVDDFLDELADDLAAAQKESAVLNAEPTLWALLILSSTSTIPDSGSSLY